jgi:integrase
VICYVFRPSRRINGKVHRVANYSGKLRMEWEVGYPEVIALKTPDKREAQRKLDEERILREKEHNGLLPPRAAREAAKQPLQALHSAFLAGLRGTGATQGTLDKYESNFRTLTVGTGWQTLANVSARSFCDWRAGSKLAPKTLNDILKNASTFLNTLVAQKVLPENPLAHVRRADTRLVERFRRALDLEEQKKLLAKAPHFRSVIYLLVLETGMRRKEMHELKVGDFCFDTPAPFVLLPASITKNKKPAHMRLRPHVVAAVKSILPENPLPSEWVFHRRVPRISTIKRDLAAAGILFETENGRVDLHALRVTFCTNLLNANVHPRVVQELMRHSDLKLTMKAYTDPSQLPLAAALESLPVMTLAETSRQFSVQRQAAG